MQRRSRGAVPVPSPALMYPFSAVCGMGDAKRALLCAAVSPGIRSVLVSGPAGTAKTQLARSLEEVCGRKLVNLPLNATEEQVFGGMDTDATIREGRPVVQEGLLSRADGGILYIDDANLMDRRILSEVLDCVREGRVVLEREGVSAEYSFDTFVVATMNPDQAGISAHVLDRFDLCAGTGAGGTCKAEVLKRNMKFQEDPLAFRQRYAGEEMETALRVAEASEALSGMEPDGVLLEVASAVSVSVGADGYRGELAMVNAAMALAALNGRDSVIRRDMEEAAAISFPHRRRILPDSDGTETVRGVQEEQGNGREREASGSGEAEVAETVHADSAGGSENGGGSVGQVVREIVFSIGEQFRVIDLFEEPAGSYRKTSSRKGGRALVESCDGTGRYARSRIPDSGLRDLAFDATVRAAAPYQRGRARGPLAVDIRKQDIRLKVRERRSGCTIMFLVDSSGSLGISNRMSAVKGAVLSMLRDSYVKRDRIGMIAFRQDTAELVLPPTKSVEYSYRMLENLPTGGKTPLSEALVTARDYMTSYASSHAGEECYVVLISDCIGNVPVRRGADPNEEARGLAAGMSVPQTRWIVIDTGSGLTIYRYAENLARALGADYIHLKDLDADSLAKGVRDLTDSP